MSVISTVIARAQALLACPGPAIYGSAVSSESLDPMARRIRVEVCVDRVELCAALEVGGITPSAGMIRSCCEALEIPIMVMLRPRAGDFVYSEAEFAILCADLVIRSLRRMVEVVHALGSHAPKIAAAAAVEDVHVGSACRVVRPSQMSYQNQDISMGRSRDSDEYLRQMTSTELVRAIDSALH